MKLRWSVLALQDLQEIKTFIEQDNPRAAIATSARIRQSANRLKVFPRSGRALALESMRVAQVPGLPYCLVYRIEGEIVLLLAVWHGARQWPFG